MPYMINSPSSSTNKLHQLCHTPSDNIVHPSWRSIFCLIAEVEMKHHHQMMIAQMEDGALLGAMEKNNYANQLERKKRLTSDQLDSLETSFQEEIKLDPDRKMKLAQELGLHPRQIAVWFQNRRARWKNKQLERLYDALKQEFDVVSREKQKLQEEVLALRTIVKEQVTMKQHSAGGYTEISGDETVDSTSVAAIRSSNNPLPRSLVTHNQNVGECNYVFNVDGCNLVMPPPPYWGVLPPPYP